MSTYHDRYARFGVIIGILVGVAIIAIAGLFFPRPESENGGDTAYTNYRVVVPMDTYELSENGYIGWSNEGTDWCDQFINFTYDGIQVTGQVSDTRIEVFIRDTVTGVMARVAGDDVNNLELQVE